MTTANMKYEVRMKIQLSCENCYQPAEHIRQLMVLVDGTFDSNNEGLFKCPLCKHEVLASISFD